MLSEASLFVQCVLAGFCLGFVLRQDSYQDYFPATKSLPEPISSTVTPKNDALGCCLVCICPRGGYQQYPVQFSLVLTPFRHELVHEAPEPGIVVSLVQVH